MSHSKVDRNTFFICHFLNFQTSKIEDISDYIARTIFINYVHKQSFLILRYVDACGWHEQFYSKTLKIFSNDI